MRETIPRRHPEGAVTGSQDHGGMLDAERFLGFAERLRAIREQLGEADLSDEQRGRWQRRLIAITDGAQHDLHRAVEQLGRLESELDRRL